MNIIAKKIKEYYYDQILKGDKKFEIRKEDDCRTHCIAKLNWINDYGTEVRPKWCPLIEINNNIAKLIEVAR